MTRILIVDDSPTLRQIEKGMLAKLGFPEVEEAADGLEALKMIACKHFDLVLMDWRMPVMSGLETLKQMKSHPDLRTTQVVMVTSESKKQNILEALQAGACSYIVKPFDAAHLKEKIGRFLYFNPNSR